MLWIYSSYLKKIDQKEWCIFHNNFHQSISETKVCPYYPTLPYIIKKVVFPSSYLLLLSSFCHVIFPSIINGQNRKLNRKLHGYFSVLCMLIQISFTCFYSFRFNNFYCYSWSIVLLVGFRWQLSLQSVKLISK